MIKRIVVLCCVLVLSGPAMGVDPDEILSDPVLEQRAREISANVRCVVCQNEPIDSSDAGVARDLRLIIRERLVAGDTNDEIFDFLVARYGEFVLFKPAWSPSTYALWLTPLLVFGFGVFGVFLTLRSKAKIAPRNLSAAEQKRLDALMSDDEGNSQ